MADSVGGLPRIPRDKGDDYGDAAIEARRAVWRDASGGELMHVAAGSVPAAEARGKVENFVGHAQVPIGVAGPLAFESDEGPVEVYVPMATTEGAMVASYSRGMRLAASGAGIRTRVLRDGLSQHPMLVFADAAAACEAALTCEASLDDCRAITKSITTHGALGSIATQVIGRRLILRFVFTTGDAIGINMASRATDLCLRELAKRTGALEQHVHGQDVEKRANARAFVEGRGRSVVADCVVPREALEKLARTTPEQLVAIQRSYTTGFAQLGTQNWLVQAANGLAGVFLACGQDLAYLTESATGMLDLEIDADGDLYVAVTLPSLLIGTVGGGSGQGTARECLDLLGCAGSGRVRRFAQILAATVLAGDLSLMAAFTANEFTEAHERLGRNRPEAGA
jgi:hydroxymethylglutaryl-CoA reductase (NADPH)